MCRRRMRGAWPLTQRSIAQEALREPSGAHPLWRELPSWFVFGDADRSIAPSLQRFMAARAGARRMVEVPGASHAIAVSHPGATAEVILCAARRLWRDAALGVAA